MLTVPKYHHYPVPMLAGACVSGRRGREFDGVAQHLDGTVIKTDNHLPIMSLGEF